MTIVIALYARILSPERVRGWMRETLWFVWMIFPSLLRGVFVVGVIGKILPQRWIETWLGGDGVVASFLTTLIGSIGFLPP